MSRAGIVPLLLLACEPSETNVNRVYPDITVTPTSLEFGEVPALYGQTAEVTIINAGLDELDIERIDVVSDPGSVFSVDQQGPLVLQNDEQLVMHVVFQPETYVDYTGSITIWSDDEEEGQFIIPMSGTGVYAPTPDIALSPQVIDFGSVTPPLFSYGTMQIVNEGGASVTLGTLEQSGSSTFTLVGEDPSGYNIPAGQSLTLVYLYTPLDEEGDNGTVTIPSDDPDEPEVTLTLLGNGGGDFDYPDAEIDCPSPIEPRRTVTLDGTGSSDPNGLSLTYQWAIDGTPSGSAVSGLTDDTSSVAYLLTDVAGEYEVSLVVTNSDGVSSAPARCKMDAIPEEDLHVELSWNTANADLDLHLMTSEGKFFAEPYDCNFCNQTPDWGTALDAVDDPSLDLDARWGYGPENINIDAPVDDDYQILVHYYDDNGDDTVVATVKVWSYGIEVYEGSYAMSRDWVWQPGDINWPEGTVGVRDEYWDNSPKAEDGTTDSGPRGCYTP